MNYVAEEMLMHYGMPRRSGRYPWGSGDNPYQHSGDFLSRISELKKQGLSEKEIADEMKLSTTQLRAYKAIAKTERRSLEAARAKSLREDGHSLNEIAEIMGYKNDSSIRVLLDEDIAARRSRAENAANFIRDKIEEKGIIDVGAGVDKELGISPQKLKEALTILEAEGYPVYNRGVSQVTNPGQQTITKVIGPKDTEYKDVYDSSKINSLRDYISYDDGETFKPAFVYPESMDSKRLKIRYAEDGGSDKDGVVEIRRGVKDLSLGEANYAQVRILVDGTHYIKGMAVYSDDMPDGVDVVFNTNKGKNKSMKEVLKPIHDDPDNPFGSLIKEHGGQSYYIDENGKEKLSLINKRAEEGDWGSWSDALPSQFLSKQSQKLIDRQLKLAEIDKATEFEEIKNLTNPTVKKKLLETFANDCDAAAENLQAAALPRQKYQVILPVTSMKDNEVYAPNYNDGETVALVRYPHGGTFEIPILKVNNKQKEAQKMLGKNPLDAVGINKNVAERLSGADFDGDTVMVIPCNSSRSKIKITSTPPLKQLEGFDNKSAYPEKKGMKYMKDPKTGKDATQMEMGKISNLITDMTLKGASEDELARAVKHSMVVIDAAKHKLNYKQSEEDNGIKSLKKKYQGRYDEDGKYHNGASTLISQAKSPVQILKRKGTPKIDTNTGELVYKQVEEHYTDKNGKDKIRYEEISKMRNTKDARTLSTGTKQEERYAEYANKMKSLANQARLEQLSAGKIEYSASANKAFKKEVDSLDNKLNVSLMNAPRERKAQLIANSVMESKKQDNPDMTRDERKKLSQQALINARKQVGAKRTPIEITDKEWEAIQQGAIHENKLWQILNNTDLDKLRERATPRTTSTITPAKQAKINAMKNSGYTNAQIAESIGVSTSTITKYLQKGETNK